MKKVTNGKNQDTTAAVLAWLLGAGPFFMAELYQIGSFDDPSAVMLTNWSSPLLWSLHGTFVPGVISRGRIDTAIGLEVNSIEMNWQPPVVAYSSSLATAGPYQRASVGYYRDWPVYAWTCYMPTPGDADTWGCSELFGGRIAQTKVDRGQITFTVTSFLDVINYKVPANVIEITNPLASSIGATPPSGLSVIPKFSVVEGSTASTIIAACTSPNSGQIFSDDALRNGFLVFDDTTGATLGRQWSGIQSNKKITITGTSSKDYNQIQLYKLLPFAPTPGVDTFYVSGAAPVSLTDGNYQGFPYVPEPEISI